MHRFSALLALLPLAAAHTRLSEPSGPIRPMVGSSDGFCQLSYWDTDMFGHSPCCARKEAGNPGKTVWKRGQSIGQQWKRMNHAGGFVQLAVAKYGDSDRMDEYEKNIFHLNCHEQGCTSGEACNGPSNNYLDKCGEPYGGDNDWRPSTCSQSFTVPTWLPDGQYTILWTWFGSGGYGGDKYAGQSDYSQCLDFTVSGGDQYRAKPDNYCPTFKGGDAHDNNNKNQCTYHGNGSRTGQCKNAPCSGSYQKGAPSQFASCLANGGSSSGGGSGGFPNAPSSTTKAPTTTIRVPNNPAPTTKAPSSGSVRTETSTITRNGKVYKVIKVVHVKPVMAKKKVEWEMCSSGSECLSGCCSNVWSSSDGKRKCHPDSACK